MPSLRPLSTLSAWRIRTGTRRLETTAWPRAASVGARIAASNAASKSPKPSKSSQAATAPRAIGSGIPTSSMRTGRLWSRRSWARSMLAASENSTRIKVTSTSRCRASLPICSGISPKAAGPATSPNTVNNVGPVRIEPSIFRLISPYATSASVIASMAITSTVSGASPSVSQTPVV